MFETLSGVGQGDTLIPTLFCNFINDLYLKMDQLKCGLFINNRHIPMLLYADDMVVLTKTPMKLYVECYVYLVLKMASMC